MWEPVFFVVVLSWGQGEGRARRGEAAAVLSGALLTASGTKRDLRVVVPLCFLMFLGLKRSPSGLTFLRQCIALSFWLIACSVHFRVFVFVLFVFKFLIDLFIPLTAHTPIPSC